jgi:aminomuconate-semialdehyde/2-hydroxymuconate-6-semialdehyde dehydrogenase
MSQTQRIHHFINGEFTASPDARYFDKRSPVDGSVIAHIAEAGQAEVDAAVAAGRAALKGEWGKMSVVRRAELLHAVADEINRRFDDFLAAELADTGKPRSLPATSTSRAARPTSRSLRTSSRTCRPRASR